MILYGVRALAVVASACREDSADPYRAPGRPARRSSIPAVAREHFGRSGRWLRDRAALHQALLTFDGRPAALTGDDGGPSLGRRRALLIARVATAETLPAWLALARRLTVRELQAAVARARRTDALP